MRNATCRRLKRRGRRVEDDPAELYAYRNFCSRYVGRTCRVREVEKMLTKNSVDSVEQAIGS